jgi:nitrous-oxide reductase
MLNISQGNEPYLNVIKWKVAEGLVGTKAVKVNNHFVFNEKTAIETNIFFRHKLPAGSNNVIISGDGKFAAITNKTTNSIQMIELKPLLTGQLVASAIEVGGPSVDAAFTTNNLYVTVNNPNQFVRIALGEKIVKAIHSLDFPAGKISIPGADTFKAEDKYAVVANHSPYGRFTRVGPQSGLSAHLLDISADKIQGIYNASIPQTTRLSAVAMSTKINKPVFRYKIGTDPRSGLISSYKATSGKETVVRDGKRVHVYATVIRSHITPDYIEVEQGDTVSIHITSTEQARDTTHGFTIDTYDVHGSFEPGKTASVTFVADRAGVFPFYCTEFCSALHLEMQGYLLVKPSSNYEISSLMTSQNNPQMKSFFKYIKGE